jgi:uncharacterized protein (DUF1800 family)
MVGAKLVAAALGLGVAAAPAIVAAAPSAADLALLNRASWGVSASSAADFEKLGADRWLERQLHPPITDRLPPEAEAQIAALTTQRPMVQEVRDLNAENQFANGLTDPDLKKNALGAYQQELNVLARDAATRSLLRDLYSPDQLKEEMTWFWMNHFNVHLGKANLRAMVGDYEESAIRPRALGRFRDLLEATLRHPAMLRYLDNADNAAGHINENYARELMELHTMGVGSGYTQKDVQELARILTGVGIDPNPVDPKLRPEHAGDLVRQGLFEFNPNRHDYGDKVLLGQVIKGRGFGEVEEALDILSRQPATARHVSFQLAQFFVADNPPPALVGRMAQAFQRTDGDIAQVLDAMFHDPLFRAWLGAKFKDPVHYVVSAVRLAYDDKVILNAGPMQGWLGRLAEGPYNHETPDGYPMTAAGWDGPGQMSLRFEIARQIGTGSAGLFKPPTPGAADQPAYPQLQNALYYDALAHTLSTNTAGALGKAISAEDWNTLYLASPEFMRR